mgnify:CR=1 FL=1
MNGTLSKHLAETDRTATERINRIVKVMAEQDNTNEQLKETNQLLWVGLIITINFLLRRLFIMR